MTTRGGATLDGRPIRAGVVGLGAMGRHHVRVYGDLPGVELVGVADPDASAVARATKGRVLNGYASLDELVERERPDVLTIAVPTGLHHDAVLQAVARGVHVLVEKPIASTLNEAHAMIAAAERAGVRLMVGHIERFNPAVIELKRRLTQVGTIYQVTARRVGPFPARIRDVGVVVDLASHDIDAMRFILGRPICQLYAETAQHLHSAHEDLLLGVLRFEGNVVGALDINWLTPTKIRELSVTGSEGTLTVNYLTQDLAFFENSAVEVGWHDRPIASGMSEGHAIRYAFARQEPLAAELTAFIAWVRDGGPCPAPPEDATETLGVALSLLESARTGMPIRPAPVAPSEDPAP